MIRAYLLMALLAAGCSTAKSRDSEIVDGAAPGGEDDIVISALADASLPKGECGMILWTLEANQPAAILRLTAGKGAEIVVNGKVVKLAITNSSGAAGFGVYEEQSLAAAGITASVTVTFGLGFDGGSYLERGLVTIESATGWRTVIPAAGVAGCRSK